MPSAVQPDLFGRNLPSCAWVAGLDEAGRGPLAGPVFAAAVILDPGQAIAGLADSKALSAGRREALALEIRDKAKAWHIAQASVEEIDRLNILQASLLAMQRACDGLGLKPQLALVDGRHIPAGLPCAAQAVVRGDALHAVISAASILAKTARDADCLNLHAVYPVYGFDRHKGYGTVEHRALLAQYGPCPAHRRSFAPVRQALAAASGNGTCA